MLDGTERAWVEFRVNIEQFRGCKVTFEIEPIFGTPEKLTENAPDGFEWSLESFSAISRPYQVDSRLQS